MSVPGFGGGLPFDELRPQQDVGNRVMAGHSREQRLDAFRSVRDLLRRRIRERFLADRPTAPGE